MVVDQHGWTNFFCTGSGSFTTKRCSPSAALGAGGGALPARVGRSADDGDEGNGLKPTCLGVYCEAWPKGVMRPSMSMSSEALRAVGLRELAARGVLSRLSV